jgi:hypothetical protein
VPLQLGLLRGRGGALAIGYTCLFEPAHLTYR